ncbi:MAG: repressor LexA [Clostridia bacterium]|nr:repressor LexA [Clostridia bacterium]
MRKKDPLIMQKILDFANDYRKEYGESPSITKVSEHIHMARSTVYRYLLEMNDRDMIKYSGESIDTEVSDKYEGGSSVAALVGSVRCGAPQYEEQNIEYYFNLPDIIFGKGEFYCLRAMGDSMTGAGIEEDDIVVCRKTSVANEGDIVVALVEGESTLKRLFFDKKNRKIILHPENDSYSDIEGDEIYIQGVATHVIKKVSSGINELS